MFGFLQAPTAPCCGRAPDLWRSHFCGLATRMHQDFGPWARLLVNRDSTFLALAGAPREAHTTRLATCCNPLASPRTLVDTGANLEYAADITLCALGIKLQDDADDEGWPRRLLAKVGSKTLEPAIDKAVARLNSGHFPTAEVADTILSQSEVEATSPDALAASLPTARAYRSIFEQAPGPNHPSWKEIGHSLGKLIYWDDAWRDWPEDRKRGRFNPLAHTPAPEFRELMADEFASFQKQLIALPETASKSVLLQVATQTGKRIPLVSDSPEESERKRRKRERKEREGSRWYDWCDCNCCDCSGLSSCARCGGSSGGKLDACFDCGPGDTGCVDCCPCDGCGCN